MSAELVERMKIHLNKLEQVLDEIVAAQGFTHQALQLKMIIELMKEQVPHEDIGSAAR